MLDTVQERISRGKRFTVNKVITPKLREVQSPCSPALPQTGSSKSFTFASMKKDETTGEQRVLTLQQMGSKAMPVKTWRTDENSMAIEM